MTPWTRLRDCRFPFTRPMSAALAGFLAVVFGGSAQPARASDSPATYNPAAGGPVVAFQTPVAAVEPLERADLVRFHPADWQLLLQPETPIRISGFPLRGAQPTTLVVSRFRNSSPATRFVVGRLGEPDQPYAFDPDWVVLYSGTAEGFPHSRVFLALSPFGSHGWIELEPGGPRYAVTTRVSAGQQLPPGQIAVVRAGSSGRSLPPGIPLCGVNPTHVTTGAEPGPSAAAPIAGRAAAHPVEGCCDGPVIAAPPPAGLAPPIRNLRQLELAIETDYEFYSLFNNLDEAGAYVVALYGAVSHIFVDEVRVRVDLTFVRLWDTPDDLFNDNEQPLGDFRSYWNANMGSVHRDAAQFLTGRRNLSAGGVAYLAALCNNNSYSWAGYALGYFASLDEPDVENRDIVITAHELGHNTGTGHTHDYGLDTCADVNTPPRRGTIMSYCSQTVPGGDAITDLRFERTVRGKITDYTYGRPCIVRDCNQNGIRDALDISSGFSADVNGNGVPDECEDCNGNGVLDPADIASGNSLDLNGNGMPDECEPDCNRNNVPDDRDIQLGTSQDLYENNIPDECEPDCNANGQSDYNELMQDMTLDIDRNARLDACEDCDGNGLRDDWQRGGSHDVWIASAVDSFVRRYHTRTGVLIQSVDAGVSGAADLLITPDRRIVVASTDDDRVVQVAADGTLIGDLVTRGRGGLDAPSGLTLGPAGDLFVSSRATNSVLRYDSVTGEFLGEFVAPGSGGLSSPWGLTFAPSGNLVVASGGNHSVREYDGLTGAFVRVLVSSGSGGLNQPRGLTFKSDGALLVCSYNNLSVLEYDGISGAFLGKFNDGGTDHELTLDGPWGVRIGPDAHVYVTRNQVPELHINRTRIYKFDGGSGIYLHNYVNGHASELWMPTGFAFMPDGGADCNANAILDVCDLMNGTSIDRNGDGVPDECDPCTRADLDGDGFIGQGDLAALLSSYGFYAGLPKFNPAADLNGDLRVDQADLALLLGLYNSPCP